jgi:hypothetical protein
MANSSSQAEFIVQTPGVLNAVAGAVMMALDLNNNPQAASNNNPVPIVDAYDAPVTATWTAATALNAAIVLVTQGMDSVAVTIQPSGTITAGAITFEVYDGANWVPIKCARETSYNTDSTYSLVGAGAIQGWTVPAAAFPQVRIRLSTAITGTSPSVLVTAIASSAPDVSVVTADLDPQQAMHPGVLTLQAQQVVNIGSASASSAVVQATTNRIVLIASSACWVAIGSAPNAVYAGAGCIFVPAGMPLPPIAVTGGVTKVAVVESSAAGYLSILESV